MALTVQEHGATLSAIFHCTLENVVSPTKARITMSTVSFSTPDIAIRDATTHFWSMYHESSGTISVFTKSGETREGGRFVTPSIPRSRTPPCTRFEQGNSLVRLLATTAAEVAYYNGDALPHHRLIVTGKYVQAQTTGRGLARGRSPLVKLVVADSRLTLLGSKPGEFIYTTNDIIRYTRL